MVLVREMLDILCDIAKIRPRIAVDPALYRPTEARPAYDTTRIFDHVGWRPEIPFRQSLEAVYADILARRRSGA